MFCDKQYSEYFIGINHSISFWKQHCNLSTLGLLDWNTNSIEIPVVDKWQLSLYPCGILLLLLLVRGFESEVGVQRFFSTIALCRLAGKLFHLYWVDIRKSPSPRPGMGTSGLLGVTGPRFSSFLMSGHAGHGWWELVSKKVGGWGQLFSITHLIPS